MKPIRLFVPAIALSTMLWSCGKKEEAAPAEGTATAPAEEVTPTAPPADDPALAAGTRGGGGGMMGQMAASCPMMIEDAKVEVADTDKGVALTFTTEKGDVADLRARVQQMATMYQQHGGRRGMMWHQGRGAGMGPGPGAGRGMGMGPGGGQGMMPASTATVTEVDKGARIELVPTDAAQLATLREHARFHQQRMSSGECWMMQEEATGTGTTGTGTTGTGTTGTGTTTP